MMLFLKIKSDRVFVIVFVIPFHPVVVRHHLQNIIITKIVLLLKGGGSTSYSSPWSLYLPASNEKTQGLFFLAAVAIRLSPLRAAGDQLGFAEVCRVPARRAACRRQGRVRG